MFDIDDLGASCFGGIVIFIIFLVIYLVVSVPEIEECHAKGGVIARIEGKDKCIEPPMEKK